jgi:hypothetical protein
MKSHDRTIIVYSQYSSVDSSRKDVDRCMGAVPQNEAVGLNRLQTG